MPNIKDILSSGKLTDSDVCCYVEDFLRLKGENIPMESKQWDHEKSLYEILHDENGNLKNVFIDMQHKRHKSDDGFGCINIYIPHNHTDNKDGFTEIGINHTGFTYDGDAYPGGGLIENLGNSIYEIDAPQALKIMMRWCLVVAAAEKLESCLVETLCANGDHINEDCVITKIKECHN